MDKNQKELQRKQENTAFNHALIWVAAAIVLELLLMLVNQLYFNYNTTMESLNMALTTEKVLVVLRIATLLGAAALAILAVLARNKRSSAGWYIPALIACITIFACCHITLTFQDSGVRMLFLLVPACAGLSLVYYLYQRDFFVSAGLTGLGTLGLWMIRSNNTLVQGTVYVYLAFVLAAYVLCAAVLLLGKGKSGRVHLGPVTLALTLKQSGYLLILFTLGVNALCLILGLALGGTLAYYLIFLLVAWLFALLVYFTVKMI